MVVSRTPCRSAASPPHERFVDVTPISLRRDRPLQRLVGQLLRFDPVFLGFKEWFRDQPFGFVKASIASSRADLKLR